MELQQPIVMAAGDPLWVGFSGSFSGGRFAYLRLILVTPPGQT
jgi:hypothetical protein